VTVQWAQFDGLGRRLWKVVTNSGPHDGTVVYYYDGQRIIQTTDGSENMVQQFIHGTQYIDELVMMRRAGHGDLYVHQDANWNVIGATDLNGRLVERYEYTPYGEPTVHQESGYGDYDGDGDVDATDEDAIQTGGACRGGSPPAACRVLDLDFDGDYDSADETLFASLDDGYMAHPGRRFTSLDEPFGHQGLLFDAEIGSYQNRARQYDPRFRRFMQRDPGPRMHQLTAQYADGPALYRPVSNNPGNVFDPFGLCGWTRLDSTTNQARSSFTDLPSPALCPDPMVIQVRAWADSCQLIASGFRREPLPTYEDRGSTRTPETLPECDCRAEGLVVFQTVHTWYERQVEYKGITNCEYECRAGRYIEYWHEVVTWWGGIRYESVDTTTYSSFACQCG
jgi:RHS repeat-associated protein